MRHAFREVGMQALVGRYLQDYFANLYAHEGGVRRVHIRGLPQESYCTAIHRARGGLGSAARVGQDYKPLATTLTAAQA